MRNLLSISQLTTKEIQEIFSLADEMHERFEERLKGKTFALFFPDSSIRTRVSYELAIRKLGGEIVSFPDSALDKKEDLRDVVGYLENWVDCIILRHRDYQLVEKVCQSAKKAVINAMTGQNHPCEILTDLYTISKMRTNLKKLTYLFIGPATNIGYSWLAAADKLHFPLLQVCPEGEALSGTSEYLAVVRDLDAVLDKADVVITDGVVESDAYFADFQITKERVEKLKSDAILNLTPPFYRGGVISKELELEHVKQFAGYGFKENLLYVQAAIILWCCQ